MMTDPDRRRRDIARIHIIAKELGLSEDERRDVIFAIAQRRSCSELDYTGLARVRAHFEARVGAHPRGAQKRATDPQSRKIRALWLALAAAGKVDDRSEKALLSFVKRQTGRDRLEWCSAAQKAVVIEALKAWMSR